MNKGLKGFMGKFEITNKNLAKELELSENTISFKVREAKFNQKEIYKLIKYFKQYDSTCDANIFFEE